MVNKLPIRPYDNKLRKHWSLNLNSKYINFYLTTIVLLICRYEHSGDSNIALKLWLVIKTTLKVITVQRAVTLAMYDNTLGPFLFYSLIRCNDELPFWIYISAHQKSLSAAIFIKFCNRCSLDEGNSFLHKRVMGYSNVTLIELYCNNRVFAEFWLF